MAHRGGATSFATCSSLTAVMDRAFLTAFDALSPEARTSIAILALGGYGRGELFPGSDVDVMVLCPTGDAREEAAEAAKKFLHFLWDAGVNVGHSVRTVEEAIALHGKTLDAWTSMLESRFLFGDEPLALSLYSHFAQRAVAGGDTWFIEGVLADQKSRQEHYGTSVKLLEPNIKKSSGGLRDLHAIFWLYRGNDPRFFRMIRPDGPATRAFADALLANGQIESDQHDAAITAIEFLFRVRHEMHYQRESQHDTLEYALQLAVAEGLGYGRHAQLRSVEVFMRDYYRHARKVHTLNLQLGQRFRESIEPSAPGHNAGEKIRGVFIVDRERITVDAGIQRFSDPELMFESFVLSAERDLDLSVRLRSAIERSADTITADQTRSPKLASMFRRIIHSNRVAAALRDMNELNILGAYIPEFGELVAFFQHNVYHYFTADEHTVIALANAENLRMERGMLHEVYRLLRRKDVLFMAVLLHDIAKPRGVGDHEITGVAMANEILRRLGMEEMFPDVAFLIRNHLVMEQIAFRRNIHDAGTIREFAARFERPELLDYLYVLTYADLSAVNTSVWTEWKAAMLQELYRLTSEVLRKNLRGDQIDEFHEARREAAVETMVNSLSATLPREDVLRHLGGIQNDAYVSLFTEEEIAEHIRRTAAAEGVSALFNHAEGYTEVTVIARDAPFALSKFCAVLSANDANIFDANIFTRNDGIIIDRFRVGDASSKHRLEPRVCAKIEEDLKRVVDGRLDIAQLFRDHHRKWKRRPKSPVNPTIRRDVEFEETQTYTIIDVYAPDSVGFLFRITETISRLGLDIYFAKIATRVDGIVDAFYVLDRAGKPLNDPAHRELLRHEILGTIRDMAEKELT